MLIPWSFAGNTRWTRLQLTSYLENDHLVGILPTGSCDNEHVSGGGASLRGRGSAAPGSFIVGPGLNALSIGAAKLPSGALISQNRPKTRYGGLWSAETDPSGGSLNDAWYAGGNAFLGFSDQGHAGWIGLNLSRIGACVPGFRNGCFAPLGKINVTGYAYETKQGVSIRAGQTSAVPEPGTLGLLALGAIGLAALRRRQVVAQRS